MRQKYVITFFVSTSILVWGCEHEREGSLEAERRQGAAEGSPAAQQSAEGAGSTSPAPDLELHSANGISYAALVDAEYQDELSQGIASSRATLPSGVIFSVISSPDLVPADRADALQLDNARRGARERGEILEDADTASRPFASGDIDGHRIIYRTRAGGTVHTEVFTFETERRTVTVFIELTDPPDRHTEVVETLTRSLSATIP